MDEHRNLDPHQMPRTAWSLENSQRLVKKWSSTGRSFGSTRKPSSSMDVKRDGGFSGAEILDLGSGVIQVEEPRENRISRSEAAARVMEAEALALGSAVVEPVRNLPGTASPVTTSGIDTAATSPIKFNSAQYPDRAGTPTPIQLDDSRATPQTLAETHQRRYSTAPTTINTNSSQAAEHDATSNDGDTMPDTSSKAKLLNESIDQLDNLAQSNVPTSRTRAESTSATVTSSSIGTSSSMERSFARIPRQRWSMTHEDMELLQDGVRPRLHSFSGIDGQRSPSLASRSRKSLNEGNVTPKRHNSIPNQAPMSLPPTLPTKETVISPQSSKTPGPKVKLSVLLDNERDSDETDAASSTKSSSGSSQANHLHIVSPVSSKSRPGTSWSEEVSHAPSLKRNASDPMKQNDNSLEIQNSNQHATLLGPTQSAGASISTKTTEQGNEARRTNVPNIRPTGDREKLTTAQWAGAITAAVRVGHEGQQGRMAIHTQTPHANQTHAASQTTVTRRHSAEKAIQANRQRSVSVSTKQISVGSQSGDVSNSTAAPPNDPALPPHAPPSRTTSTGVVPPSDAPQPSSAGARHHVFVSDAARMCLNRLGDVKTILMSGSAPGVGHRIELELYRTALSGNVEQFNADMDSRLRKCLSLMLVSFTHSSERTKEFHHVRDERAKQILRELCKEQGLGCELVENYQRRVNAMQGTWLVTDVSDSLLQEQNRLPLRVGKTPSDSLGALFAPMGTAPASQSDLLKSLIMSEFIDRNAQLESAALKRDREDALEVLRKIVQDWGCAVYLDKGFQVQKSIHAGGKLFVLGSYVFGVADATSDIDVVCVVPKHITRDDFFNSLRDRLRDHPEVNSLLLVPHAYVPVIQLKIGEVSIDLLFAKIDREVLPKDLDLGHDDVLRGADMESLLSLNGPRSTQLILRLVGANFETFKTTLRLVRYWAKQRGIYSNKVGFLGGINWAILVAFLCQLFPTSCSGQLFFWFFHLFASWSWPQEIRLCDAYDAGLGFALWNSANDRSHIMPIITPAYPATNSSVNVTHATMKVMKEEFARGKRIMEKISSLNMEEKRATNNSASRSRRNSERDDLALDADSLATIAARGPVDQLLKELCSHFNIFESYSEFVCIELSAGTQSHWRRWSSYVESRIRKLVNLLEDVPFIEEVRPDPRCFPGVSNVKVEHAPELSPNHNKNSSDKPENTTKNVDAPQTGAFWIALVRNRQYYTGDILNGTMKDDDATITSTINYFEASAIKHWRTTQGTPDMCLSIQHRKRPSAVNFQPMHASPQMLAMQFNQPPGPPPQQQQQQRPPPPRPMFQPPMSAVVDPTKGMMPPPAMMVPLSTSPNTAMPIQQQLGTPPLALTQSGSDQRGTHPANRSDNTGTEKDPNNNSMNRFGDGQSQSPLQTNGIQQQQQQQHPARHSLPPAVNSEGVPMVPGPMGHYPYQQHFLYPQRIPHGYPRPAIPNLSVTRRQSLQLDYRSAPGMHPPGVESGVNGPPLVTGQLPPQDGRGRSFTMGSPHVGAGPDGSQSFAYPSSPISAASMSRTDPNSPQRRNRTDSGAVSDASIPGSHSFEQNNVVVPAYAAPAAPQVMQQRPQPSPGKQMYGHPPGPPMMLPPHQLHEQDKNTLPDPFPSGHPLATAYAMATQQLKVMQQQNSQDWSRQHGDGSPNTSTTQREQHRQEPGEESTASPTVRESVNPTSMPAQSRAPSNGGGNDPQYHGRRTLVQPGMMGQYPMHIDEAGQHMSQVSLAQLQQNEQHQRQQQHIFHQHQLQMQLQLQMQMQNGTGTTRSNKRTRRRKTRQSANGQKARGGGDTEKPMKSKEEEYPPLSKSRTNAKKA